MSEFDDTLGDRSLRDAFENFRAGSLDTVLPEGPDAVRHTVRRRHRARVAAVAVVAALVVLAGGAGALAALNPAGQRIPPAHPGSPTPTTAGSASPSGKPKPSGSQSPGSAPDGVIGANELMNATIDVPAWGGQTDDNCSSGRVTFHNGEVDLADNYKIYMPNTNAVSLPPLYFEDVDRDGAKETIAVLWCGAQGGTYQAIALDRDTDGNIVTLGQIASTFADDTGFTEISQVTVTADGDVQLKWTRQVPGQSATSQWRTYSWTGSGFEQSDGPTAFPTPTPTGSVNLSVAAPNVTMTANGDGTYGGTLSVTVTNTGDAPLSQFRLRFNLPQGAGFTGVTSGTSGLTCKIVVPTLGMCNYSGSLPAGGAASASATLHTTSSTIPTAQGTAPVDYGEDNTPLADTTFTLTAG